MIAALPPRLGRFLASGMAVWLAGARLVADDWLQWRGPDRSNASRETGLLKQWPTNGPPLAWRVTGIGLGIHSVSVAGGRVFTVGNRDGGEFVFALDAWTGQKLWARRVDNAIQENALMRWLTQRSPTVDGDRLYTFTASGELLCLRVGDGQKVWQRSYPKDFGAQRPTWGFTEHPLVDGERVICSPFSANAAIAALNKHTGEVVWKSSLEERITAGYAALVRSTAGGVPQFILFHGRGLAGLASDDGRLLWRYARRSTRTASTYTPIARDDLVLSPNGYGGELARFKVVRSEHGFSTEDLSPLTITLDAFQDGTAAVDDRLYLIERGAPVGVNMKAGVRVWSGGSTNRGARAALTWADGHLYVRDARGTVALLQTLANGVIEKGRFQIPEYEPSIGVTSPVLAHGRLWLRDNDRLFSHDVSGSALTTNRPPPRRLAVGLTNRELGLDPDAARLPRVGVDREPDAVFVPTPHDIVGRMFQEAEVKKTDVVVDLGSGDGRLVIAAAKNFGCKAIGYEIDAKLVEQSRVAVIRESLDALVTIEHKDIFSLDLSGADVVTVFLYPGLMERLIPQFEKLKPGSRIVSHQFEMPGVKPEKTVIVDSKEDGDTHRILLWRTPLRKE